MESTTDGGVSDDLLRESLRGESNSEPLQSVEESEISGARVGNPLATCTPAQQPTASNSYMPMSPTAPTPTLAFFAI
jgi:hypothetical protein